MTVIIGIDPHKATHMAVAIDGDEQSESRGWRCERTSAQTQRLLAWAAPLGEERTWAIESADGLGGSCYPNSSSPRVNTSWMCPPRCGPGSDSWGGESGEERSERRVSTAIAGLRLRLRAVAARTTPRGCGSVDRHGTSPQGPRPRVDSTPFAGTHPRRCSPPFTR